MTNLAIAIGILLILVGGGGYVYGMSSGSASVTALIPAFFGIALVALGAAGAAMENIRKHLMHVAVVIALLGFIIPLTRLLPRLGELTMTPAVLSQVVMSALCLVFVIGAVRSFMAARRT